MVINFSPDKTLTNIAKSIKEISAREQFKKYPETKSQLWGGHLWSPSYFMSTLGNVSKEIVIEYVNQQLTKYNNGRPRH